MICRGTQCIKIPGRLAKIFQNLNIPRICGLCRILLKIPLSLIKISHDVRQTFMVQFLPELDDRGFAVRTYTVHNFAASLGFFFVQRRMEKKKNA